MKGLIKVGYACNNHCTFCHTLDYRDVDGTGPLVMRKIERAKALGYTMVVLSGGEVTMRKELLLWAARTASLGMDFGLVTNGRMLAYPDLVAKLLRLRLKYVYMSLHGGEAKVHNSLVRTDAFAETHRAILNLVGRGLDLTVNTVVTKQNVEQLRPVVDLLLPLDDLTLKFSMVQPKGGANVDHAFRALIPEVAHVAARVHEAIAYGQQQVATTRPPGRGPRFAHDGIPLCLLPGFEDLYDDLQTHGFAAMTEAFEPDFFPVDDADKVQPRECEGCALAGPCPGLHRTYHELRGGSELKPLRSGLRSNSFSYLPGRTLPKRDDGGCPIYDSPLPYHLGRHLLLDGGDHVVVHHTRSRDFSEVEIARVKRDAGQLYLDACDKDAPDDFAADLKKIELAVQCRDCDKREGCAGTYVIHDQDVFARDDERLRTRLREIAARGGTILDVGCGDGRYGDLFAPAIAAGRLRYVGVEPDPSRAAALADRLPGATIHARPIEDYLESPDALPAIDALLLLRSWNHLAASGAIIAALLPRLAPGGVVVLSDNIAFGLVRTHPQQRRAARSTATFEHHRNDDSHAARAAVSSLPLDLVEHSPVVRESSNQWLLVYRRRAP